METIYKYKLDNVFMQQVKIPNDAKILCVNLVNNEYYIWVRLNPN